jgi:hypothetical protein
MMKNSEFMTMSQAGTRILDLWPVTSRTSIQPITSALNKTDNIKPAMITVDFIEPSGSTWKYFMDMVSNRQMLYKKATLETK